MPPPHPEDSDWEPPAVPPSAGHDGWLVGWRSLLPVGFVILSLVALLLVPVPVQRRTETLWRQIAEVIEPARRLLNDIEFALALESSAIRGYLLTRDEAFLRRRELAIAQEREASAEFHRLAALLGPEVSVRAEELDTVELQWRMPIARLLDGRISPEEYITRIPLQQALYEELLATAATLENKLREPELRLREQIQAAHRYQWMTMVGLGLLALAAAFVVARQESRLRRSFVRLGRYAREEARLLESEHEARTVAERAARARDEVLRIVSHDLRNPLNNVALGASVLSAPSLNDEQRSRQIDVIQRAVQSMNRLIQDLLDVAKIETGVLSVEPHRVEVGPMLSAACAMLRPLAAERSVRFECTAEGDLPAIWADRERLIQIFSNLVGNCIRFTPEGGSIRIVAEPLGSEVRFAVTDSGTTIAEEDRPYIFDPYHWRPHRAGHRGAGLGLQIARGIVETHGGRLWLEPGLREGNTFAFTLPVAAAEQRG